MTEYQQQFVDGLRELATFLEQHPDFISEANEVSVDRFVHAAENADHVFYAWAQELGDFRLVVEGSYAMARRDFGPHRADVNIKRDHLPSLSGFTLYGALGEPRVIPFEVD